jgi:hypothetical protein
MVTFVLLNGGAALAAILVGVTTHGAAEPSGVRLVVVVHLPHPGRPAERPSQERALEASAEARLLSRGEAVAVWAIKD